MRKCAMGKVCRGIVVVLLCVAAAWPSGAEAAFAAPEGVALDHDGTIRMPGVEIRMEARAPDWNWLDNAKWLDVRREEDGDAVRLEGRFSFRGEYERDEQGVPCDVVETLSRENADALRAETRWKFSRPVRSPAVFAAVKLAFPIVGICVDGQPVEIPESFEREQLIGTRAAHCVEAELNGGRRISVSGNFELQIQDNRRWGIDNLEVRVHATRDSDDEFTEAGVSFVLAVAEVGTFTVPLQSSADAGGASDPFAGLPGRVEVAGFPFEPSSNRVALGRGGLPGRMVAEVPAHRGDDGAVALLHAADWALVAGQLFPRGEPVGRIVAEWSDGGEPDVIDVGADIDVGHWGEAGAAFSNAVPAWSKNAGPDSPEATLYASVFPLPGASRGRRLSSIAFEAAHPAAAWFVAAATLATRPVRLSAAEPPPHEDREDSRWAALAWGGPDAAAPGSALDFSFIADALAPAGRDGFVKATPDGFLSFENAPQKRLRLFGVNLCEGASFLPHHIADRLVETLRRTGYNAVRIHHHDGWLVRKDSTTSLELDPDRLDKLDYLVAACKRGGLYLVTDLYVSREFRPGDGIDCKCPETLSNPKGLFPVSEKARENLKSFARAWLGHVNPYTGLSLKDDPVLAGLTLVNEELIELTWGRSAELVPRYRSLFGEWKAQKGIPAGDETSFKDFLGELEKDMMDDLESFARNELRLRCPMNTTSVPLDPSRQGDFAEAHTYFAHPVFPGKPWRMPVRTSLRSPIRDGGSSLALLGRRMQPGKPFLVTEIYYCHPAPHRLQGTALAGAFAGLQGWSGMFVFTWSSSADRINGWRGPPVFFEGVADPMQQLAARVVSALFARGDMPQSHSAMRLDRDGGTFAAVSPCAEALALERGDLSGDALAVSGANRECVVAAVSRDGAPLPQSADVLVVHITNMSATGLRWEDGSTVSSWGGFPLLVERGTARVCLAADGPRRVEALDADGNPVGIVPAAFENGRISFLADVSAFPCGVVAYRLRR